MADFVIKLCHVGLEAPRNSLDLQVQTPQNYCPEGELPVCFSFHFLLRVLNTIIFSASIPVFLLTMTFTILNLRMTPESCGRVKLMHSVQSWLEFWFKVKTALIVV